MPKIRRICGNPRETLNITEGNKVLSWQESWDMPGRLQTLHCKVRGLDPMHIQVSRSSGAIDKLGRQHSGVVNGLLPCMMGGYMAGASGIGHWAHIAKEAHLDSKNGQ